MSSNLDLFSAPPDTDTRLVETVGDHLVIVASPCLDVDSQSEPLPETESEAKKTSRNKAKAGDPLTPRELSILGYLSNGLTSLEIATLLVISVKTVEAHRARIFTKLEASNAAHAVRIAIEKELIVL